MKSVVYSKLNNRIKSILLSSEGWLVGGSVNQIVNDGLISDYDIIVPDRGLYHNTIVSLMHLTDSNYTINNYGGFKFKLGQYLILDIWCEELSHFLANANEITYLYNHKKCILLKNVQ
jgi:hypothetical protein